ncbi:MAG TPA: glycosyltransferase, partial [Candidatus Lokiarchaeia archaeon]|nr:glycosyltransferase [Candidatus Lokiarchaeia archaeon]
MRICLLGRSTPVHPGSGGFEKYLFDLARGLSNLGHDVHIVTKRLPSNRKNEEVSELDGFHIHWVGPCDSFFWYSFPFFFEMGKTVARLHRERPFDIIHSNNLAAFALFLVRPTDPWPPLVCTAHGTSVSEFITQPKTIFQKIKRSPRLVSVIPLE